MHREDPRADADWIMEAIVDDFAESLAPLERVQFYARIAELASERSAREERRRDGNVWPKDDSGLA